MKLWQRLGTSICLLATACGSDGSVGGSPSGLTVVAATPVPTPTPTPTPTPSPAATATVTGTTAVIVQSGDSIGAGFAANYAAIDHLGFPPSVVIHNVSVVGIAMQAGYGQRETNLFPFVNTQVPSVLVIQQGTNDLSYGTVGNTLYQSVLKPFVSSAHAAGFYVVVETLLPREQPDWTPALEAERGIYNTLVRVNTAGADAINDLAADPVLGDGTHPATSSYYVDGLHLSLSGQQRVALLDAGSIGPFLQRPAHSTGR